MISLDNLKLFGNILDIKLSPINEYQNSNVNNSINDKVIVELTSKIDSMEE